MENKEIVIGFTEQVICPYCGYEHDGADLASGQDEDIEIKCSECEKKFIYFTHYDVSFCSRGIENGE